MNQPLFISPVIELTKVAYDTRIDDDIDDWPVAIVREAYKQLPFLKSYETEVEIDKVDSARGYGVGKLLVWPARQEKHAAAQNKQLVTVPVIIRNRELAPLDVYTYRGEMAPMDQDKVAGVLFRPEVFERRAARDQFTGTNLSGQLTPPATDHQYNAGSLNKSASAKEAFFGKRKTVDDVEAEITRNDVAKARKAGVSTKEIKRRWGPLMKQSSDRSVMAGVRHAFARKDMDRLGEKLASHAGLRHAYTSNPVLRASLAQVASVSEKTASDKREDTRAAIKPTVVQFRKSGMGYICKTANHRCYDVSERKVSRFEVQEALSAESFASLQ